MIINLSLGLDETILEKFSFFMLGSNYFFIDFLIVFLRQLNVSEFSIDIDANLLKCFFPIFAPLNTGGKAEFSYKYGAIGKILSKISKN